MEFSATEIITAAALFVLIPLGCAAYIFWQNRRPITVHVVDGERVTTVVDGKVTDTGAVATAGTTAPGKASRTPARERARRAWASKVGGRLNRRLLDWRFRRVFNDHDRKSLSTAWNMVLSEPLAPVSETVARLTQRRVPVTSIHPPREDSLEVTVVFEDGTVLGAKVSNRHSARLLASQLWYGPVVLKATEGDGDSRRRWAGTLWFDAPDGELPLHTREIRL